MRQSTGILRILTYMCFGPEPRVLFSTSEAQKVARARQFFHILTCKCASRHSDVPLFFRDRKWQNRSRAEVFCTFWLANVLCATAGWHFATSDFQNLSAHDVLCTFWLENVLCAIFPHQHWCFAHFGLKICFVPQRRAISVLNSYLRTRCFSEPTFRSSGTTNHEKNTANRDVPNISPVCTFFLVILLACWFFLVTWLH